MNILEMAASNPDRPTGPPESMFLARKPDGEIAILCFATVRFFNEEMCGNYADFQYWEVTQEHMTQEEIDEFVNKREAVIR